MIKLFLARRISLEWTTAKSKAALHLAACKSHVEVAQALIDHGANLEQKTYRGDTPLHLATKYTNPQIVELLLSRGASRFGVTNEGKTARELVQKSKSMEGKECLRILETFGPPGYQAHQTTAKLYAATAQEAASESDIDSRVDSADELSRGKSETWVQPHRSSLTSPRPGSHTTLVLSAQSRASSFGTVDASPQLQSATQIASSTPQPSHLVPSSEMAPRWNMLVR